MTRCWEVPRSVRRCAGGALLLTVLSTLLATASTPAAAAPAQDPGPTITVTPSTIQAGEQVTLTGTCPPGATVAYAEVHIPLPPSWIRMGLSAPVSLLPDGTFAWSVTIPADAEPGTWVGQVGCEPDHGTARASFEVTGGLSMVITTGPLVPGEPLLAAGSGCVADGAPLSGYAAVRPVPGAAGTAVFADIAPAAPDGSWSASFDLPPDLTGRRVYVTVNCFMQPTGWHRAADAHVNPAPVPEPTLVVSPSTVAAGNPVTVIGACPAGTSAAGFSLELHSPSPATHEMGYAGNILLAADGTFSSTVTIPGDAEGGAWSASVFCIHPSNAVPVARGPFTVTGGAPPMVFEPGTFPRGGPLHVTGIGCLAGGQPLDTLWVGVMSSDVGDLLASGEGAVDADGSWSADASLAHVTSTASRLFVHVTCLSEDSGWFRTHGAYFTATDRGALARTGPSGAVPASLPALGVALVLIGVVARLAAARTRTAVP